MSEEIKNEEVLDLPEADIEKEVSQDESLEVVESKEELLQKEVDALKETSKNWEDKYYRAYADAQNQARRANIDAENLVFRKVQNLALDILPAIDNFERALSVTEPSEEVANFLKGFEMIYNQLLQALANEGIETVKTVGLPFDANNAQAVMQVEDTNYESGVVVEELQKGYTFRNKIIRPAMVKVNN